MRMERKGRKEQPSLTTKYCVNIVIARGIDTSVTVHQHIEGYKIYVMVNGNMVASGGIYEEAQRGDEEWTTLDPICTHESPSHVRVISMVGYYLVGFQR